MDELRQRQVIAPESEDELLAILAEARKHRRRVLPIGQGHQLAWSGVPECTDLLLSTELLAGISSHVPEDGTVSVRAGTSVAALREAVRAGGHFLTPDIPEPERHSVGGLFAAGLSGPDRLRFGPARNHVLGMRVVLADGTVAKSGGQLVKNVTGYDLHRLYCGSHGALCMILEVSLRLFPEPEDELYLQADIRGQRELIGCAAAVRASNLRPLSLSIEQVNDSGERSHWRAHLRLAGLPAVLDQERAELEHLLPNEVELRAERRGPEARLAYEAVRDRMWSHREGPFLRIAGPSSELPAILTELESHAFEARPLWIEPGLAAVEVGGDFGPAAACLAERFNGQPAVSVEAFDGHSGPWPTLTSESTGLEMMRALKRRLDPDNLFARELLT